MHGRADPARPTPCWRFCVNINDIAPSVDEPVVSVRSPVCGPAATSSSIEPNGGRLRSFFCNHHMQQFRQNYDGRVLDERVKSNLSPKILTATVDAPEDTAEMPAPKAIELVNHFVQFDRWSHEVLGIETIRDTRRASMARSLRSAYPGSQQSPTELVCGSALPGLKPWCWADQWQRLKLWKHRGNWPGQEGCDQMLASRLHVSR